MVFHIINMVPQTKVDNEPTDPAMLCSTMLCWYGSGSGSLKGRNPIVERKRVFETKTVRRTAHMDIENLRVAIECIMNSGKTRHFEDDKRLTDLRVCCSMIRGWWCIS